MELFKRKRKAEQLYVAKTEIISEGIYGISPEEYATVTRYFLVEKQKNGEYREIFSKEHLKSSNNCIANGVMKNDFDIPVILEIKPISKYLSSKKLTDSKLFYFINEVNTSNQLKELEKLGDKNKIIDDEYYDDEYDYDEYDYDEDDSTYEEDTTEGYQQ